MPRKPTQKSSDNNKKNKGKAKINNNTKKTTEPDAQPIDPVAELQEEEIQTTTSSNPVVEVDQTTTETPAQNTTLVLHDDDTVTHSENTAQPAAPVDKPMINSIQFSREVQSQEDKSTDDVKEQPKPEQTDAVTVDIVQVKHTQVQNVVVENGQVETFEEEQHAIVEVVKHVDETIEVSASSTSSVVVVTSGVKSEPQTPTRNAAQPAAEIATEQISQQSKEPDQLSTPAKVEQLLKQDDATTEQAAPVTATAANNNNNNSNAEVRTKPEWVPDEASETCQKCQLDFLWWWRRRHHCRNCGALVCGWCSDHSVAIPTFGYDSPVRVCDPCFKQFTETQS